MTGCMSSQNRWKLLTNASMAWISVYLDANYWLMNSRISWKASRRWENLMNKNPSKKMRAPKASSKLTINNRKKFKSKWLKRKKAASDSLLPSKVSLQKCLDWWMHLLPLQVGLAREESALILVASSWSTLRRFVKLKMLSSVLRLSLRKPSPKKKRRRPNSWPPSKSKLG